MARNSPVFNVNFHEFFEYKRVSVLRLELLLAIALIHDQKKTLN